MKKEYTKPELLEYEELNELTAELTNEQSDR